VRVLFHDISMTSRGGQTYSVITNDAEQISTALNTIQTTDDKQYPCMVKLEKPSDSKIFGTIIVRYHEGSLRITEEVYFEFDIRNSRCYIIGKSGARDTVVNEFNRRIESNDQVKVIQNIKLNGKSIYVDMLKIITDIDKDHFIKTLQAKFGINGWKTPLDKHKVMEIKYGFIHNICVSKHKESQKYADNAFFCRIKFGIWKLGDFTKAKTINEKPSEPMSIEITTDYTFRFFWDYEPEEILSVMKKLSINPSNYTINY